MRDTRSVVERYLEALAAGDLAVLTDRFADDALPLTPDGARRGIHEITLAVAGEIAVFTRHAACLGTGILMAVSTFIMRDGRIAVMSSAVPVRGALTCS